MSSKQRLNSGVTNNVVNPDDPPPDDPLPGAPAAPTGFTANPSLTSVALDWANNTELDLASYKVYRFISGTWTLLATVTAPTSAYTATGLTAGTSYSFRVTAYDTTALESTPASLTVNTDPAAGAPAAPTGFTANPSTTSVALDWANNTEPDLAGYRVYRLVGGTWWLMGDITAPTSAYTVTGLAASTTATFHVTAYSTAGFESVPTAPLTVTTDPVAPAAPTGFVANPDITSVALDWNTNTEPDLASYKVYRQIATVWTLIHTVTAPTSAYTVTGLSSSTTYVFRITAFTTHSLESVPSTALTVTTDAATGGGTLSTFDRTGTLDIADALEAWLNNNANVPNGTGAATPTRIKFPRFQADGVTLAIYRNEGGLNGGVNLSNMVDITLDGGGKIGGRGLDGAQFVSKTKKPFIVQADATLNPKGIRVGGGQSTSTVVPPWQPSVNYPVGQTVQRSSRRYKAKLAGANHDPADPTTGSTWWTNLSPDGILTATTFDFVANGVVVGDEINITIGADPRTRDIPNCRVTNGSYIITVPAGTIALTDNGAQVDCAASGFPANATANYIDSTHLAINNYYTGATGNTTININPKTGSQNTRTVTGIRYGNNPRAISYGGASIGAGSPNFILEPNGTWNVQYTPTTPFGTSIAYTGAQAQGATAYDFAEKRAFDLNRARSMFVCTKNTRLRIRGFQFTGPYAFVYDPTLATSGYDPDYESQDALVWRGCNDCEVGDVTIEKFWGNGMEMQPFVENDDTYTPTRGLWVHDSTLQNFGRQSLSLTFGYNAIVEDCYLGESSRSLIDCEPTTTRLGTGTNPVLQWTMQDVQLLRCQIGYHRLGMLSMHEGLGRVHVDGCTGRAIGTSGPAVVDKCIYENNVENPSDLSDYSLIFNTGTRKGGDSIIVRNNAGMTSRIAGVHFNADHGPCTNFQVVSNLFGTGIPQFADDGGTNGLPFTPFTLPVPAHALRDLTIPTGNTTTPTNVVAVPLRGGVACSWTRPAQPNTYDYYELSVYGVISGTPTVPTAPNSPTSHTVLFAQRRLVSATATWAAITGASNAHATLGWVNTMFSTAHGGFADTYVCRVRGYDVASNTFGPYSTYSNPVTPTATTNAGSYITGAQLPDGTPIGIPGGTTHTPYAGSYGAVSGAVTNKVFTQTATSGGPSPDINCAAGTVFTNCLFVISGTVDAIHSPVYDGSQVRCRSGGMVTFNNCEIRGGGPGSVNAGIDWGNFTVNKSIIHSHGSFSVYAGSGCNVTLSQSWLWDQTGHSYDIENVTNHGNGPGDFFAHRNCMPTFGDSSGGGTITNCLLELHSDQNTIAQCQSSQGPINKTHNWSHNWVDGGGGRCFYADGPPHTGSSPNTGTYLIQDNKFMRHPYGFWSQGSFAGTPSNPACVQVQATGPTIVLGSPDTNRWWEPGFTKPIGT